MRFALAACLAMLLCACGERPDVQRMPLDVMAERPVEINGQTYDARTFTVLEAVVIDTGVRAAPGDLRFAARYESDAADQGIVAVRVGSHVLQSIALEAGLWREVVIPLAADVPAVPIELAIDVPGRYSLTSPELAASEGAG